MAHLLSDISKYFKFDETTIDNWFFKLFHKGCVVLFLTGSMVGILSQYFGEPISCDFKGVDVEMATDYCWIHGSSYIPKDYQQHMKCVVDQDGFESADDAPDTSYYQWVTFMLLFQAGSFILPYKAWKHMEGGLIKAFGTDGRAAIMLKEELKFDDGIVMEAVVEKFVKYFRSILHHNNWYFAKFVGCEVSNVAILFFNFWATDKFLKGKFRYYGWDVFQFLQLTKAQQKVSINPFCQVFPTEVSCTVPNIGAAGGEQHHNGLCILSQNIINEKMYLVIWMWLVALMVISLFYIMYRIATIFFDCIRFAIIMSSVHQQSDKDLRKATQFVLSKCQLGDWFVLSQLGKNVNVYFFRAFLKDLRNELREKPKRSRSSASTGTLKSQKNLRTGPSAPSPVAMNDLNTNSNELARKIETDSLLGQDQDCNV